MNKNVLFASLLFACFFSFTHAQLFLNQYSGHFLDSASYGIQGTCIPDADFYFSNLDPMYDTIATGTEVVVILTSITPGIQVSGQNLVAGDTIRFDTSNYIEVRSASPGVVRFQYWMVGTPTVPNEHYTCGVLIGFTLAECANTVIPFNNFGPSCQVDPGNSVLRGRDETGWQVYPNPSKGKLGIRTLRGGESWETIDIFDVNGRHVRRWNEGEIPDLQGQSPGMYFLEIKNDYIRQREKVLVQE